jgi:hypothetical protein
MTKQIIVILNNLLIKKDPGFSRDLFYGFEWCLISRIYFSIGFGNHGSFHWIGWIGLGSFHFRIKSEPLIWLQHKDAQVHSFILWELKKRQDCVVRRKTSRKST